MVALRKFKVIHRDILWLLTGNIGYCGLLGCYSRLLMGKSGEFQGYSGVSLGHLGVHVGYLWVLLG